MISSPTFQRKQKPLDRNSFILLIPNTPTYVPTTHLCTYHSYVLLPTPMEEEPSSSHRRLLTFTFGLHLRNHLSITHSVSHILNLAISNEFFLLVFKHTYLFHLKSLYLIPSLPSGPNLKWTVSIFSYSTHTNLTSIVSPSKQLSSQSISPSLVLHPLNISSSNLTLTSLRLQNLSSPFWNNFFSDSQNSHFPPTLLAITFLSSLQAHSLPSLYPRFLTLHSFNQVYLLYADTSKIYTFNPQLSRPVNSSDTLMSQGHCTLNYLKHKL